MKQPWLLTALDLAEEIVLKSPAQNDISDLVKQVVNQTCRVTAESAGRPDEESVLRQLIVLKILRQRPAMVGTVDSIYLQTVNMRPRGPIADSERVETTYVRLLSGKTTTPDLLDAIRSARADISRKLSHLT
jgi:hypothetical protein